MATRVVEWKKPYTWGKAISIDENKVISLNLRDENNLIIYDEWDDEIYVDLQLDDEITPTSAFPIWVNVGRVIVDNWWDKPWTIISAETTSGDNIKIFYADEWTLWIDNWTGTFKQIYFKSDVDALLLALRNYIDWELAKKQNWVSSDIAPSNPSEWDLWYDTTSSSMKVWDWTAWQSVGTGWGGSDIVYATQAEYNALLPWALTDGKHYFIYTGNSRLPNTFQEVEYIQSSWSQYFIIWTQFKTDNKVVIDLELTQTWWDYVPLWINNDTQKYAIDAYGGYFKVVTWWSSWSDTISENKNRHTFEMNKNIVTVDGTTYSSDYSNVTIPLWLWVFAYNEHNVGVNYRASMKLYKLDIYDASLNHLYDLVPCYRKADSVIWMYDLVNDVFYTNSWTWAFTKWPNV